MADITIDSQVDATYARRTAHRTKVWISPTVCYQFYNDSGNDMAYKKTTDGGATWGDVVLIHTPTTKFAGKFDIWYERWTKNDTGTLIHIVWLDSSDNEINHRSLDTSDDSLSAQTVVFSGNSFSNTDWRLSHISICKARGGDLHVAAILDDNVDILDGGHFSAASPYTSWSVADGSGALYEAPGAFAADSVILLDANDNSADDADIVALYDDVSTNSVTLKSFDASASSWSEGSGVSMTENSTYLLYDALAVHDDDDTIVLCAWNSFGFSSSDLKFYENDSPYGIWTTRSNIITNDASAGAASLFINHQDGTLYAVYSQGSAHPGTQGVKYKSKTGPPYPGSWGSETDIDDTADGNRVWVDAGYAVGNDGGKMQPSWVDDAANDLFTNVVNDVDIAATALANALRFNSATGEFTLDTGQSQLFLEEATGLVTMEEGTNKALVLDPSSGGMTAE